MTQWKGFGRKRTWLDRGNIPECAWRERRKPRKTSGKPVSEFFKGRAQKTRKEYYTLRQPFRIYRIFQLYLHSQNRFFLS